MECGVTPDVLDFVGWLRDHNDSGPAGDARLKVGFYGLDLYSLHASMGDGVAYLRPSRPRGGRAGRGTATPASTSTERILKPHGLAASNSDWAIPARTR